jgi:hypothetical protein
MYTVPAWARNAGMSKPSPGPGKTEAARANAPALPVAEVVFEGLSAAYRSFRGQGLFEKAIQAQATRPR